METSERQPKELTFSYPQGEIEHEKHQNIYRYSSFYCATYLLRKARYSKNTYEKFHNASF